VFICFHFSSTGCGKLENHRTFEEREVIENSPECNEGELVFARALLLQIPQLFFFGAGMVPSPGSPYNSMNSASQIINMMSGIA